MLNTVIFFLEYFMLLVLNFIVFIGIFALFYLSNQN